MPGNIDIVPFHDADARHQGDDGTDEGHRGGVDALKGFPDNRIVLKTKKGDGIYQKIDIFKGLMWYSYPFDRNNMMAIPVEQVKAIIENNKKGVLPEQLEDFAFIKEQKNNDYGEEGKPADLSKLE